MPKKTRLLALFLVLGLLLSIAPVTGGAATNSTRISNDINSYIIHWGTPSAQEIEDMKKFDMAIIEPYTFTDTQLKELHSAGVKVIAYVPTTSIDQQFIPFNDPILDSDYLKINGQKVTNTIDNPPDWVMDPRSSHYRQVISNYVQGIYNRGFDGVFLDTVTEAIDFSNNTEVYNATVQMIKEIRDLDQSKLIAQNGGWWRETGFNLIDGSAPYIDFMMWEHYQYEKGTSDSSFNSKRNHVIDLANQYGFKVIAAHFINWNDNASVEKFYDDARSYGFIPYAPWTSGAPIYNTVNTYYIPERGTTSPEPAPTPAPEPTPAPGDQVTGDVQSYVIHYGTPTAQQLEDMKKFDMAITEPKALSDAQLKELQAGGVKVIGYIPTLNVSKQWPQYTGLENSDYLWANGSKVSTQYDWLMDPHSAHYRQLVTDNINSIYARGFDGVFLAGLGEIDNLGNYTSLDAETLKWWQVDLGQAANDFIKSIKNIDQNKLVIQDEGYKGLINDTAASIDYVFWSEYPYENTQDAVRDNLAKLADQNGFNVLTSRFFNWNDNTGVENYYNAARAKGFIPYAPWTSGSQVYNTVNIYDLPTDTPATPQDTTPPAVDVVSPTKGATGVNVDEAVSVTFAEKIEAGSAYDQITLKDAKGNLVSSTKNIVDNKLTITPSSNLAYNTSYNVVIPVKAVKDAAGNELANQYSFDFTTLSDKEAPTAPTNLTATAVSSSSVKLSWNPSTDNAGIDHYEIYRLDRKTGFVKLTTTKGTSITDTGLKSNSKNFYYIIAFDAAGNKSLISDVVTGRTLK